MKAEKKDILKNINQLSTDKQDNLKEIAELIKKQEFYKYKGFKTVESGKLKILSENRLSNSIFECQ